MWLKASITPHPKNIIEYINSVGSPTTFATPINPTNVANKIIQTATTCTLLCYWPASVRNIIFMGMKNCNNVTRSKTGKTVAGQKSRKVYIISIEPIRPMVIVET